MAAKLDLPGISHIDPDIKHSYIGPGWQAWRELDYFIAAANITNDKQKMNLLLHHAGPKVWKIFKKTLHEPEEERTFKSASDALDG